MNSSQILLKTHRVRERCTLKLSRAQASSHWCGVVVRRGVSATVLYSSLRHDSKLQGPSPKAFAKMNSATLIFTHSPNPAHSQFGPHAMSPTDES
ncbi:hypothetical protein TNCV_316061 [Trichonephila clavipes]|nr:hypothetical protein TNCV_316061 [Trichonephila clavipes]